MYKTFSDQEILENSPSDKWEMKEEVLLLIISVALTAIVYVLIAFIKKFIWSRPPGRRLVTSDLQVEDGKTKFRGPVRLKISFSLLVCKPSHFCVESERGRFLHYIRALGT